MTDGEAFQPRLDIPHLRRHLQGLGNMLHFLRTLPPEGPRYKLWLGDLVQFVNDAFGPRSQQMAEVRAILTAGERLPPDADETLRRQAYVARLDRFGRLLASFQRHLADPLPLIQIDTNGSGARKM